MCTPCECVHVVFLTMWEFGQIESPQMYMYMYTYGHIPIHILYTYMYMYLCR